MITGRQTADGVSLVDRIGMTLGRTANASTWAKPGRRQGLTGLRDAWTSGLLVTPLLLVYQMGKVGSQTIEATLRQLDLSYRLFRTHSLSAETIAAFGQWLQFESMPIEHKQSLRHQLAESAALHDALRWRRRLGRLPGKRSETLVIAGVRDPVGVMLAMIFQNRPFYFPRGRPITTDECYALLTLDPRVDPERRQHMTQFQEYLRSWFERELKATTGIDVLAMPFDHEHGYVILENRFVRAMVYRRENLTALRLMLNAFLSIEVPQVINRNIGAQKDYALEYETVLGSLRLPSAFLGQWYAIRWAAHFYTAAERQRLTNRWLGGPSPQPTGRFVAELSLGSNQRLAPASLASSFPGSDGIRAAGSSAGRIVLPRGN